MVECTSVDHDFHETTNMYPNRSVNISNDQQSRLNKINEIQDHFIAEIRERELMSQNLSKYIASFEYFDKSLIVLSVATGSISIASFATVTEEVFRIKKVKNRVPWTYVIYDLNSEEIIGTFYEKELQKTNQQEFRIERVIKRKGNKLYVKWKGYDNSFNSWIDKKDLV